MLPTVCRSTKSCRLATTCIPRKPERPTLPRWRTPPPLNCWKSPSARRSLGWNACPYRSMNGPSNLCSPPSAATATPSCLTWSRTPASSRPSPSTVEGEPWRDTPKLLSLKLFETLRGRPEWRFPTSRCHGRRGILLSPAPCRRIGCAPAAAPRPRSCRRGCCQPPAVPNGPTAQRSSVAPTAFRRPAAATSSQRFSCRGFKNQADRFGETRPIGGLALELRAALGGEAVKFGVPAGIGCLPLGDQQTPVLQPMQRGVQRALLDRQDLAGDLSDSLGDGVAVNGSKVDHFQDQEIESALGKIGLGRRHGGYLVLLHIHQNM